MYHPHDTKNQKVSGKNYEIDSLLFCCQFPKGMLEKGLFNGYGSQLMVGSSRGFMQVLYNDFVIDHGNSRRYPLCDTTDIHKSKETERFHH